MQHTFAPIATSALLALILFLVPRAGAAAGLTESARLAVIYDTIVDGDTERARLLLRDACPPAPREACLALEAVRLWWEIQIDPFDRRLDAALSTASDAALAAATAWTNREPARGEAWFYLAGSFAPITQWRVLRGERVAAARSGLRIKDALERALRLDPSLKDAYFGIGLYHYYADVAPAALKMLRWLMMLPGGDRAAGLREMLTARDEGLLLRDEADWQLHYLYVWYERQPDRAIALLRGLDARHPANPLFLQRLAEVHRDYRKDPAASRAAWEQLRDRARSGRVAFAPMTLTRSQIELAADLIALGEPQRAVDLLVALPPRPAAAPYGAAARAALLLGRAFARLNDRQNAIAAFERAIAVAPRDDPEAIAAAARDERARVRRQK